MDEATNNERIKELSAKVEFLSEIIIKAQKYAHSDPEVSLTQARKSAEAICRNIFSAEIGEPGKIMLDELIRKLAEKKIIPTKVLIPLGTIQAYGNFGSHVQSDPYRIETGYIQPCLLALAQVVDWYFREYLKRDIPETIRNAEAATAQNLPPQASPPLVKSDANAYPSKPILPKKKKSPILLLVVAAAVVCAVVGVYFLTRGQKEEPKPTTLISVPTQVKIDTVVPTAVSPAEQPTAQTTLSVKEPAKKQEPPASQISKGQRLSTSGTSQQQEPLQVSPSETSDPPYNQTLDVEPKVLGSVEPDYPRSLKDAGITGEVKLLVLVDENGTPVKARVQIYQDERMSDPARDAAMRYKFSPALLHGKHVRSWTTVVVRFVLNQ